MSHLEGDTLRGRLLHAGGHALTGVGVSYLLLLIALTAGLPFSPAVIIGAGVGGFVIPAVVQEGVDTDWFSQPLSLDNVRDATNYSPTLGLSLLFAGQIVGGLAVLVLAVAVEVIVDYF